jgi:hypothetical protein
VVAIVTVPPEPVAAPEANVTAAEVSVHVGLSTAPVGEVASTHELSVTVWGPRYKSAPVAVIADVPLEPGATVTAAAESEYVPTSVPVPVRLTVCGEFAALSAILTAAVSD